MGSAGRSAAWDAWTGADPWDKLRQLSAAGVTLVAACPHDHGCTKAGKVPSSLGGYHLRAWEDSPGVAVDALRDAQAGRWRRGLEPLNVGIACGRPLPGGGGLAALDIDGAAGEARVHTLVGRLPANGTAWVWRTGGGHRVLYRADASQTGRSDDSGHEGIALQAAGRFAVIGPSWHHGAGRAYALESSATSVDLPLPEALARWAAERPADLTRHEAVGLPLTVRPADVVAHDLALHGVRPGLLAALQAPGDGADRSGRWMRQTQSLLGAGVPIALVAEASLVPAWGYGAKACDDRGWLAAELPRAAAYHQRLVPETPRPLVAQVFMGPVQPPVKTGVAPVAVAPQAVAPQASADALAAVTSALETARLAGVRLHRDMMEEAAGARALAAARATGAALRTAVASLAPAAADALAAATVAACAVQDRTRDQHVQRYAAAKGAAVCVLGAGSPGVVRAVVGAAQSAAWLADEETTYAAVRRVQATAAARRSRQEEECGR